MLLIRCPYCDETLPELEFSYSGQAHVARPEDPSATTDEEWRDFLYIRTNAKGPHYERWRHVHGCARFFNAVRDTVSDRFLATYEAGAPAPDLASLAGALGNTSPEGAAAPDTQGPEGAAAPGRGDRRGASAPERSRPGGASSPDASASRHTAAPDDSDPRGAPGSGRSAPRDVPAPDHPDPRGAAAPWNPLTEGAR